MGNIFPRWTNFIPFQVLVALGGVGTLAVAVLWYAFTPKYTRVGYEPQQPIPFDHSLHAGQLGMDCRYCHSNVEQSPHSNIPNAQVCWNCHGPGKVKSDSPKLALLREAMDSSDETNYTGEPIRWVQIHETPDYAYFNHAAHVNRGVSCVECHGKVNEMAVVSHQKSLSMGFCLDCHRNVEDRLRPLDEITNLDWAVEDMDQDAFYAYLASKTGKEVDALKADAPEDFDQKALGAYLKDAWNIHPPQDCAACHR